MALLVDLVILFLAMPIVLADVAASSAAPMAQAASAMPGGTRRRIAEPTKRPTIAPPQ